MNTESKIDRPAFTEEEALRFWNQIGNHRNTTWRLRARRAKRREVLLRAAWWVKKGKQFGPVAPSNFPE
jgi:hypothetical protein